jgi:hypothetical protein
MAGAAQASPFFAASGSYGGVGGGSNWNIAVEYSVSSSTTDVLTVSELGVYDAGFDGLLTSHQVALYQLTGPGISSPTLLQSVTVPAGTAADLSDGPYPNSSGGNNGFRYEALTTPIVLTPGLEYGVAAYGLGGSAGEDPYGNIDAGTVGPDLTFLDEMLDTSGGAGYPSQSLGNSYFGAASFAYSAAVPEPASIGLVGMAAAAVMIRRRRRL